MSVLTSVSVYAMTPGKSFTTPITVGIQNSNVRGVNPVRDGSGNWIGKMNPPPSNYNLIYSEIVVGRDEMSSDVTYYYANRTVSQMITAINS